MEDKQTNQLTVIDAEGNEVLCQILFTYHSDEFNKDYVIFYPVSSFTDESEQLELMAASYVEGENGGELSEITTDEEWEMIEDVLEEFEKNLEEHEHGHCHCHEGEGHHCCHEGDEEHHCCHEGDEEHHCCHEGDEEHHCCHEDEEDDEEEGCHCCCKHHE